MHSVSKHVSHVVVIYIFIVSFTFILLLVIKCYNGVAFRILKQITIKESLGVGKNTLHRAVSLRQHGSFCM